MEQLNRIAERFASELEDRLGERVLGIYLFGSGGNRNVGSGLQNLDL